MIFANRLSAPIDGMGLLEVGWLKDGTRLPLMAQFLAVAYKFSGWTTGTFYAVGSTEATSAGEWHSDTGQGLCLVGAVGIPESPQEFKDFKVNVGDVVVYTDAVHRRPETPEGYRVFLSATLYWPGQTVDLSCPRLASLVK